MLKQRFGHILLSLVLCVAMLGQGTMVLAGTTGTLSGTVTDSATNQPISGASVSVSSPSQSATASTDTGGHFVFLSLAPDTYLVSVQKQGYDEVLSRGVTVIADQQRTLTLSSNKTLQTIGRVSARSVSSLVRPGTTADVYSVLPSTQAKLAGVGGGGNLSSAWSAIATIPGAYVQPAQNGYVGAAPSLSIRGGDYDQIGYEIDGVPVNRSFDNYPSGPVSSLGQQELQVYTGGGPANAEAQGISGFINQVIRTGSSPGFVDAELSVGGPAYYHKASIELGGATTNRNFSYYVGLGGYNQDFRIVDQFNGNGVSNLYGTPIAPCADAGIAVVPSCYTNGVYNGAGTAGYNNFFGANIGSYALGSANLFDTSTVVDRDSVINLHFGIPRKSGLKDDIQVLGMANYMQTYWYTSPNDLGGAAFLNAIGYSGPAGVPYTDGFNFNSPTGVFLPANYQSLTSNYLFPGSATNRSPGDPIAANLRDSFQNNQGIFKVQYTHPFSDKALFKLYGYTYYSNWLQDGPNSAYADFFGPVPADYELSSHTRGISGTFLDQINSKNLVSLQGSFTTASTLRDNNTQMANSSGSRSLLGYVVDSSNPTNGLCYPVTGGAPVSCADPSAGKATITQAFSGTITPASGTCGGGPCRYLVVGNGQSATFNTVTPNFLSASLTDDFKPTNKLDINAGIRYDLFQFQGADTSGTPARTFLYNAFNLDNCIDASGNLVPKAPTAACPAGSSAVNVSNPGGTVTQSYPEFEPRIGMTYTLDPSTVLRASYGRYAQPPNAAYEQYNTLQANAPATLYGTYGFQKFGFLTPNHRIVPPVSNNYDFSIEHQFPHQISVKLTPFWRSTQNQIQNFYLNQQTSFVSGLNVGQQTSKGIEFELDKGDFDRDGLAAKLSFTYTNSSIKYTALPNGTTIIDPLNNDIASYNAYTSACAPGGAAVGKSQFGHPLCGTTPSGVTAAPCYAGGAAISCGAAGAIANPYYNAPVQGLLDPNASYATYDTFPAGVGSSINAYGAPFVGTLVLNYKKNRLAVTPILQFFGGQRYGAPESTYGIQPDTCTGALGPAAGDPRYNYGSAGGAGYDATTCTPTSSGGFAIPNPYTKAFDGIGAFVAPSQLLMHLQLSYEASKNVTLVANLANVFNSCFGGTKVPWSVSGLCGYETVAGGSTGDIGNQYNPGAQIQPYVNTPYEPTFTGASPFSFFLSAKVKM